ncbi:hypothetical protein M5D96_000397, partial [Drosophila gunungcola]
VYGRNICQLGGSWQTVGIVFVFCVLCASALDLHRDIQRYTTSQLFAHMAIIQSRKRATAIGERRTATK